jgi:SET domain-containing protein
MIILKRKRNSKLDLPKCVKVWASQKNGFGIFALEKLRKGKIIGICNILERNDILNTSLKVNHSDTPNCIKRKVKSKYVLIAKDEIKKDQELTLKYELRSAK